MNCAKFDQFCLCVYIRETIIINSFFLPLFNLEYQNKELKIFLQISSATEVLLPPSIKPYFS